MHMFLATDGKKVAEQSLDHSEEVEVVLMTIEEAEKQMIVRALKETNGNRTEAAKRLGISRRTLHRKLHVFNLNDL